MLGREAQPPSAMPAFPLAERIADWSPLLPGIAFWSLALYLPLSLPLARLEETLATGPLPPAAQQLLLVITSLALALGAGLLTDLGPGWALGPGWGSSLGLMAALWGLFWTLASRSREREND